MRRRRSTATRGAPDCTAPVDVVSVDALLSARAFHRSSASRNYAEADLLLEQLRAVCGVVVDDEKMSWRYSDHAEKPAEAAEGACRRSTATPRSSTWL